MTNSKNLVVDLLEKLVESTDNELDDRALQIVKKGLRHRINEKKTTEEQFSELHQLVTKEFLQRVKSGEATTQDLKAACDWLKSNDITGVAYDGSPLSKAGKCTTRNRPRVSQNKVIWQTKELSTQTVTTKLNKKRTTKQKRD